MGIGMFYKEKESTTLSVELVLKYSK